MIWLARHGQTEANIKGLFNGRLDSALTPLGEAQARQIGVRLRSLAAEVGGDWSITPSTAGRARRTAQLMSEMSGVPVREPDPRLAECDFGEWDGLTRDEILALRPDLASVERFFLRHNEGDTFDGLSARVRSWMDEALSSPDHCIAVSHAGTGRMIRGLHLGLGLDELRELETAQGVIYRFFDGGHIERIDCTEPAA